MIGKGPIVKIKCMDHAARAHTERKVEAAINTVKLLGLKQKDYGMRLWYMYFTLYVKKSFQS